MTETRFYEPVRLSNPPKPLFSLQPLDATTWLRSLLSKVFHTNMADVTSFEDLFPIIHSVPPRHCFQMRVIYVRYMSVSNMYSSQVQNKREI